MTVLWVVGITNALNLLDNMDGLAAGVAAIAAGSFFAIAASNGQFLVAALAIGSPGARSDSFAQLPPSAASTWATPGALFLGFLLVRPRAQAAVRRPTDITFLVPVVVLGVASSTRHS